MSANRQLISKINSHVHPQRLLHVSSSHRASALAASEFASLQDIQEITLKPIFDIFDAPTRLGESSQFVKDESYEAPPIETPAKSSSTPRPRHLPTPLPPPIIFDGPAHPRHPGLRYYQSQKAQHQGPVLLSRQHHTPSTVQHTPSDCVVQIFDGPARITRYHHQSSHRNDSSSKDRNQLGIVALATIAGGVAVANALEKQPQ